MSQESLFRIIESNPGITQVQLRRTRLSRVTICEQLQGLEEKSEIRRVKFENTYRIYSVRNRRHRATAVNVRRSEAHRAQVKQKVKVALTQNPRLGLQSLAEQIGCSYSIVSTAYHWFRRGGL